MTVGLLVCEDLPMLGLNTALLTATDEPATVEVLVSTVFNSAMLGAKLAQVKTLRSVLAQTARLRQALRRMDAQPRADPVVSI